MLVSEFINGSLYTWVNQKLPSYLLWNAAMVQNVGYALNDIYTYDWKDWTFMYDKHVADFSSVWDDKNITVTLDYPIKRVVWITDLNKQYTEFYVLKVEPTEGHDDLEGNNVYFKPWSKEITLPNNDNKWYIVHYVHIFDKPELSSTIPLPDIFLWALYNLALAYAYPPYWQYGENKEWNVYAKASQQLINLAKSDSFQMSNVTWNIH